MTSTGASEKRRKTMSSLSQREFLRTALASGGIDATTIDAGWPDAYGDESQARPPGNTKKTTTTRTKQGGR
jgi:hypothetical protein